jgi:hypothetical protein
MATGPNSLCAPSGVTVDKSGNVYISDGSRVLEYNTPLTTDTSADRVFGQNDKFTTDGCNLGGESAGTLCGASGIALDNAGDLFVVDQANSRVLEYDSPPLHDTVADRVIGTCGSFTSNACCPGDNLTLNSPFGLALDAMGNLYVADRFHNRVLENDDPISTDTLADRVFGQGDNFATTDCNHGGPSADSLCGPVDVAFDSNGNLHVSDSGNHRALSYDAPFGSAIPHPTQSVCAIPTPTPTPVAAKLSFAPKSLNFGKAVTFASGSASVTKIVTISNPSNKHQNVPITLFDIESAGDFAVDHNASSCGAMLAPGGQCSVHVKFGPTAPGSRSNFLVVSDNTLSNPEQIPVKGQGAQGKVSIAPKSLVFGSQPIGVPSSAKTVMITNNNAAPMGLQPPNFAGDFGMSSNTCTTVLSANSSCTVEVTFTPTASGSRSGTMVLSDDAVGSPQMIKLKGIGK